MSQLGGSNSQRVGGVHIDVEARGAAQAQEQLNAVGGAAQNLGQNAEAADKQVKKATAGIAGWAQRLKDTTSVFRNSVNAVTQFAGRITGLIGLFGLVSASIYGVVKGIGALWDGLVNMDRRLKEAPANWQKVIDAHNQYYAVLEKIAQVQSKVTPGSTAEALVKNVDKARLQALKDEAEERDKTIERLKQQIKTLQSRYTTEEMLSYQSLADDLAKSRGISRTEALSILGGQQGQSARNVPGTMATVEQLGYELSNRLNESAFVAGAGMNAQTSERLINLDDATEAFSKAFREALQDANSDRSASVLTDTLFEINERLVGIESRLGGER